MNVITETAHFPNCPGFRVSAERGGQTLDIASVSLTGASRLSYFVMRNGDFEEYVDWRETLPEDRRTELMSQLVSALEDARVDWDARR